MSHRRRTKTRGWRSKHRRRAQDLKFLLARKELAKNLGWNDQQERELSILLHLRLSA